MKYLLLLLLVGIGSCSTPPPKDKRIDIELRNYTNHPLEIRAQAGFLGRTIRLEPNESWKGWVPPNVPIGLIQIDVREKKPTP